MTRALEDMQADFTRVANALVAWIECEPVATVEQQAQVLGISTRSVVQQLMWIVQERCSADGMQRAVSMELSVDPVDGPPVWPLDSLPHNILTLAAGTVPALALESCALTLALGANAFCKPSRTDVLLQPFADFLNGHDPKLGERLRIVNDIPWDTCDGAFIYGSAETIALAREHLPGAPVAAYGPREAIAVVDTLPADGLGALASDIARFAQRGCMSPRTVLVHEDQYDMVTQQLADALDECVAQLCPDAEADPVSVRRQLDADALTAMLDGTPPPLHITRGACTIAVLPYANDTAVFAACSNRLDTAQTAVVVASSDRFQELGELLLDAGCSRICAAGQAHYPRADWPHDGIGRIAPLLSMQ